MPVEVIWDDTTQTTVRYRVEGHWTWDDIQVAVAAARGLMAEVDHPIGVIVDLTQTRTPPTFARWRGEHLCAASPENLKLVVMVGDEALGSLFDIFARFLPAKAHYAATLDEARALIAMHVTLQA